MDRQTLLRSAPLPDKGSTTSTAFSNLDTFLDWDLDFYPAQEQRFYELAITKTLKLLGANPGDLILDAGCGVGTHSIRIAKRGYRVHAIDFSEPALLEGKQRAHAAGVADRITFEHADLVHLHLRDESFSHIFCWGVLIHIPAIEDALNALVRILKPGGRLALYVTNRSALDFKIEAFGRKIRGRTNVLLEKHRMGEGYWYKERHGDIWVWQVDIDALTNYLAQQGLRRIHRLPGMLTELYTRGPAVLRTPLVHLNTLWFRFAFPPHPAEANLLIFEKPQNVK